MVAPGSYPPKFTRRDTVQEGEDLSFNILHTVDTADAADAADTVDAADAADTADAEDTVAAADAADTADTLGDASCGLIPVRSSIPL